MKCIVGVKQPVETFVLCEDRSIFDLLSISVLSHVSSGLEI
jgi:hypothetical protein